MIEGAGFNEHISRIEGMLQRIQGKDNRVASLFPASSEEAKPQQLAKQVSGLNDELAEEAAFIRGVLDADNLESINPDEFAHMVPLLGEVLVSIKAQQILRGKELSPTMSQLERNVSTIRDMLAALPVLKKGQAPRKTRGRQVRSKRVRTRRGRQQHDKKIVREDISSVLEYVQNHKQELLESAKSQDGQEFHRREATMLEHSFQVYLPFRAETRPNEMVIMIHPKPVAPVITSKGRRTNVSHIGEGGFKNIKKSICVELVTGKIYYVATGTSKKEREKGDHYVNKEIAILSQFIGTPGIVQLKGYCIYPVKTEGEVVESTPMKRNMVMAYAETDLRGEMMKGPFIDPKRRAYNLEMMEGLAEVHKQGLIHYDLKVDNVLVVDGRPKLADFGSAERVTTPATKRGTNKYCSPELHRLIHAESIDADDLEEYQALVGARTDVFSMGIMLYRMKHYASPKFVRDIDSENHEKNALLIEEWYASTDPVDKEDALILSLLNPDPDARPSAKEALESFQELYSK